MQYRRITTIHQLCVLHTPYHWKEFMINMRQPWSFFRQSSIMVWNTVDSSWPSCSGENIICHMLSYIVFIFLKARNEVFLLQRKLRVFGASLPPYLLSQFPMPLREETFEFTQSKEVFSHCLSLSCQTYRKSWQGSYI